MRFDEVSAVYALFGHFYVGVRVQSPNLEKLLSESFPRDVTCYVSMFAGQTTRTHAGIQAASRKFQWWSGRARSKREAAAPIPVLYRSILSPLPTYDTLGQSGSCWR